MPQFSKLLKQNNNKMQMIDSIDAILGKYSCFLIDLWGVIHNGKTAYPDAIPAIQRLQKAQKKVIFLTNMPRPKELVFETLSKFGLTPPYDVVTSGDCTQIYLEKFYKDAKIYHLGENVNQVIARGFPLTTNLQEADLVLLSLFTESKEEADLYENICKQIAQSGLPVICANPDKQAAHGDHTRCTAGYFANMIEEFSGTVHYIGKPFVSVYDHVFETFHLSPCDCVMIGDTLETDILGATNTGIDSVLVQTGVTQKMLKDAKISLYDYIYAENLPEPNYILPCLCTKNFP
ncbi:MAG: Phosphoglycolate phosphatase [Holosporales bacterium]